MAVERADFVDELVNLAGLRRNGIQLRLLAFGDCALQCIRHGLRAGLDGLRGLEIRIVDAAHVVDLTQRASCDDHADSDAKAENQSGNEGQRPDALLDSHRFVLSRIP